MHSKRAQVLTVWFAPEERLPKDGSSVVWTNETGLIYSGEFTETTAGTPDGGPRFLVRASGVASNKTSQVEAWTYSDHANPSERTEFKVHPSDLEAGDVIQFERGELFHEVSGLEVDETVGGDWIVYHDGGGQGETLVDDDGYVWRSEPFREHGGGDGVDQ